MTFETICRKYFCDVKIQIFTKVSITKKNQNQNFIPMLMIRYIVHLFSILVKTLEKTFKLVMMVEAVNCFAHKKNI